MRSTDKQIVELEKKFWQSMVDQDTDAALSILHEPALMVSSHGAMKFDHSGYRKMAEQGSMIVKGFELSDVQVVMPNDDTAILTYTVKQKVAARDAAKLTAKETETQMNDSSTWIRTADGWKCVMHTESPMH